ncbi:MAG TPA: hypothetical protein VJA64_11570, partial [Desulfobaccales bacterium]|nr:hypothetical protein [Desulfobaccales bacterium]
MEHLSSSLNNSKGFSKKAINFSQFQAVRINAPIWPTIRLSPDFHKTSPCSEASPRTVRVAQCRDNGGTYALTGKRCCSSLLRIAASQKLCRGAGGRKTSFLSAAAIIFCAGFFRQISYSIKILANKIDTGGDSIHA